MKAHGEKMAELVVVEKIMRTMLPSYNYVMFAIEQANDIETMTIDGLQSSILVEEARIKGQKIQKEDDLAQALKVTGPGRSGGRGRGRNTGGRGRGRQGSKEHIECYKCHKMGHYQNECPNGEGKEANYAELDEEEEELVLMACTSECKGNSSESNCDCTVECKYADTYPEPRNKRWFLDSGCSNHMTSIKEWFFDLDESFRETVRLGNDMKLKVMGKGSIKLRIEGRVLTITGVYYIPELRNNLISVGQL